MFAAFVLLLLAAAMSWNTFAGDCVPPPNEVCETATVFSNADLPYEITAPLGCVNDIVDRPYFDVFYRFDCSQTGTYHIHMCNSSGDTYLRIYGDGCGWTDGFELAVADDECPGSPPSADPLLTIELEAGQHYWFEVGTWRPDPPWAPPLNSPYTLSVTLDGPSPGVPAGGLDVEAGPDSQLQIAKVDQSLNLSWGNSCVANDTDYAIYQGQLAVMGEHQPLTCSTGQATSYLLEAPTGNAYLLVIPNNGIVEGSYGLTSGGAQRPKGDPPCLPRYFLGCP